MSSLSYQKLTIPELIEILQPSCGEDLVNAVQTVLKERVKEVKLDSENLVDNLKLAREEVSLLNSILEAKNAALSEELEQSQGKCKELEGIIVKASDEKKTMEMAYEENIKTVKEKTNLVHNLKKNLEEMNNKDGERQLLLLEYKEKIQHLEGQIERMGQKIRDSNMKEQKMMDLQIENTKLFDDKMKALRSIVGLESKIHEARGNENKLRLEILEYEKKFEAMKRRLEEMEQCPKAYLGGQVFVKNIAVSSGRKISAESSIEASCVVKSDCTPHLGTKQAALGDTHKGIQVSGSNPIDAILIDDEDEEVKHVETANTGNELMVEASPRTPSSSQPNECWKMFYQNRYRR